LIVAGDGKAPAAYFYRHKMTTFLNRHFYDIFTAPLTNGNDNKWLKMTQNDLK